MLTIMTMCALIACSGPAMVVDPPASETPHAMAAATNEGLIKALPEAGAEWVFDKQHSTWTEHPASKELRSRLLKGLLTDAEIAAAVLKSRVIAARGRWPVDRPFAISLRAPLWLGQSGRVKVRPKLPEGTEASAHVLYMECALGADSERQRTRFMPVGRLPSDMTQVAFEVRLEAHGLDLNERGVRSWRGEVTVPVASVDSIEQSMTAVNDPEFDNAVLEATAILIGKNQGDPARTAMWISLSRTDAIAPFLDRHACCATVEIIDGGRTIHKQTVDYRQTWAPPASASYYVDALPAHVLEDSRFAQRARVRISGSRSASFEDLVRDSFWTGSIDVPLQDLLKPSR
ncbi:MAG: hypothetical protein KF699_07535 [Phycisphaeraceae bacterium]|nr:hypothetical protein [Phycisphaeraceae bacterium]MBX3405205.1 hypothetical protein [Phycisphaeraceae bacterium]